MTAYVQKYQRVRPGPIHNGYGTSELVATDGSVIATVVNSLSGWEVSSVLDHITEPRDPNNYVVRFQDDLWWLVWTNFGGREAYLGGVLTEEEANALLHHLKVAAEIGWDLDRKVPARQLQAIRYGDQGVTIREKDGNNLAVLIGDPGQLRLAVIDTLQHLQYPEHLSFYSIHQKEDGGCWGLTYGRQRKLDVDDPKKIEWNAFVWICEVCTREEAQALLDFLKSNIQAT